MISFNFASRSQVQPIAVCLRRDGVRMLQVATSPDAPPCVIAAHERQCGDVAATDAAAADLLRRGGFHGRKVVALLPREIVKVKNLRLPASTVPRLREVMLGEAPQLFDLPRSEASHYTFNAYNAGEIRKSGEPQVEVIATAVEQDALDDFVARLQGIGAEPVSLDVSFAALYRGLERFNRRERDQQDVHVMAEVEPTCTEVVIGRGHEVCFCKTIGIGSQRLYEAVARRLGVEPSEAGRVCRRFAANNPDTSDAIVGAIAAALRPTLEELAREMAMCLRYFSVTFRGRRPQRILIGGDLPGGQLTVTGLQPNLPITVVNRRPLDNFEASTLPESMLQTGMSGFGPAAGLALRRVAGPFPPRAGVSRIQQANEPDEADAEVPAGEVARG